MGRVDLRPSKLIGGIHNTAITQGETQEMAAEYIRIPPDSDGLRRRLGERTAICSWSTARARFLQPIVGIVSPPSRQNQTTRASFICFLEIHSPSRGRSSGRH
jgi:hypothetical protein